MNSIKCTIEICEYYNIVGATSHSALFLLNLSREQTSVLHSSLKKIEYFLVSTTTVEFELGATEHCTTPLSVPYVRYLLLFPLSLKVYFLK